MHRQRPARSPRAPAMRSQRSRRRPRSPARRATPRAARTDRRNRSPARITARGARRGEVSGLARPGPGEHHRQPPGARRRIRRRGAGGAPRREPARQRPRGVPAGAPRPRGGARRVEAKTPPSTRLARHRRARLEHVRPDCAPISAVRRTGIPRSAASRRWARFQHRHAIGHVDREAAARDVIRMQRQDQSTARPAAARRGGSRDAPRRAAGPRRAHRERAARRAPAPSARAGSPDRCLQRRVHAFASAGESRRRRTVAASACHPSSSGFGSRRRTARVRAVESRPEPGSGRIVLHAHEDLPLASGQDSRANPQSGGCASASGTSTTITRGPALPDPGSTSAAHAVRGPRGGSMPLVFSARRAGLARRLALGAAPASASAAPRRPLRAGRLAPARLLRGARLARQHDRARRRRAHARAALAIHGMQPSRQRDAARRQRRHGSANLGHPRDTGRQDVRVHSAFSARTGILDDTKRRQPRSAPAPQRRSCDDAVSTHAGRPASTGRHAHAARRGQSLRSAARCRRSRRGRAGSSAGTGAPEASKKSAVSPMAAHVAANLIDVVRDSSPPRRRAALRGSPPGSMPPAASIARPLSGTKQPCLFGLMSTETSMSVHSGSTSSE